MAEECLRDKDKRRWRRRRVRDCKQGFTGKLNALFSVCTSPLTQSYASLGSGAARRNVNTMAKLTHTRQTHIQIYGSSYHAHDSSYGGGALLLLLLASICVIFGEHTDKRASCLFDISPHTNKRTDKIGRDRVNCSARPVFASLRVCRTSERASVLLLLLRAKLPPRARQHKSWLSKDPCKLRPRSSGKIRKIREGASGGRAFLICSLSKINLIARDYMQF